MSLFLIILAAGDSKRLKKNIPKPYQIVNNKTILEHTINAFKDIKEIKKILVVYNNKHKKYINKLYLKNIIKVLGGKTRQESTFNALKKIKKMDCKKVLIHDSARPSPPKRIIKNIITCLKKNQAVIPIIKVTDAVKRVKKNKIFKNIERDTLRLSQTPQGFIYKNIYLSHLKNYKKTHDDDAALLLNNFKKIKAISGSKENFKITDNIDLQFFKKIKSSKKNFGIGFDVHRLVPKRKLYLAGINIKSKLGTLGHSDGDPVLHAIIDAILGACNMGDIGDHFSNKNRKFKNIRSTVLFKKIVEEIELKNIIINNVDINIICETPKIEKYKNKMINSISKLCNISQNKINIKGKTTEKLGVIGKEKAIACEALVSIIKND